MKKRLSFPEPKIKDFKGFRRILSIAYNDSSKTRYKNIPFNGSDDLTEERLGVFMGEIIGSRVYFLTPAIENFREKVYLQYSNFNTKLTYFLDQKRHNKRTVSSPTEEVENLEQKVEKTVENKMNEKIPIVRGKKIKFGKVSDDFSSKRYEIISIENPVKIWSVIGNKTIPIYKTYNEFSIIAQNKGANMIAESKYGIYLLRVLSPFDWQRDYLLKKQE